MLHGCLRHTRLLTLSLVFASAIASLGCGASTSGKARLQVYSWWVSGSERYSLQSVLDMYNQNHDDSEAENPNDIATTAGAVRKRLNALILSGAPPATFQANAGSDLMHWTAVATLPPNGGLVDVTSTTSEIAPLDDVFAETGLWVHLPDPLRAELRRFDDPELRPYAVPLDVHRLNMLYYNVERFNRYRDTTGRDFRELEVLCPASLQPTSPEDKNLTIAVGMNDGFSLVLFAFESVLPALTNGEFYNQLFRGAAPVGWESQLRRVLVCVQHLSRSFLRGSSRPNEWTDALAEVREGTADFAVMGDWSNGELKAELDSGTVNGLPFPRPQDSQETFVFTSDTFPLPVKGPHRAETKELLTTLASTDAQKLFSMNKGSIPARDDVDLSQFPTRQRDAHAAFASDDVRKVLATSGLFPPYFPSDELNGLLQTMTAEGAPDSAIDPVIALIRRVQPLLRDWQMQLKPFAAGQQ